ncbi:MAG: hypothetical protein AAF170_08180 [Bacteroidota bacterium]
MVFSIRRVAFRSHRRNRGFAVLNVVGLAIVIACFDLFGLAAHAAAQRTKEIGVRRVLGATLAQKVVLLTCNVVVLVGIALAVPVVVFGMSRWLDAFTYRVALGWEPLALAGAGRGRARGGRSRRSRGPRRSGSGAAV